MKKMKSLLSLLLSLSLLFSAFSLTAYATDEEPSPEVTPPSEQEENVSPVEVTNLEELQSAIEVAEDGDSIYIANTIWINGETLATDKKIILKPTEDLTSGLIHITQQGGKIEGFVFAENGEKRYTITVAYSDNTENVLEVKDCIFDGNSVHPRAFIFDFGCQNIQLYNCSFLNNADCAVNFQGNNYTIDGCTFKNNISILSGAAFVSGGNLQIRNSTIVGNSSGIYNTGTLTMENCIVYGNNLDAENPCDIRNEGTLNIDTVADGKAVYEKSTGTKIDIPAETYQGIEWLLCFTDEEAQLYFSQSEEETLPPSDDNNTIDPTTPDTSETPTEPEEPSAPDSSDETQETETPEAPSNPSLPSEPDITDTPDEPKEPESTPAPSRPFFPIHIILSLIKQREEAERNAPPVEQEEESKKEETEKLELSHGGAILDTSIPLVLLGYGDGKPHENDPITRAQIAVLLYRSLTDESKTDLTASTNFFADVKNGEWYCDAVSALSSAGIINGCDGLFSPSDNLTWGQLIALLTRFVEPKTAIMPEDFAYHEHWAYNNIVTAVAYGWIDDAETIDPDQFVTRGEAVAFVNSIFEICENPI